MRRARRLAEPALTKSDLEEEFLALCRAALLSSPEVNAALVIDDGPPIEVDFLWRTQRLAVETDAFGTHGMRHSSSATGAAISASSRRRRLPPLHAPPGPEEPDSVVATLGALLARAGAAEPR